MTNERSETTLADFVRVIRRHRLLIAFFTVICAGAALGLSLVQLPSYDASASLAVRDPSQDLALLGSSAFSNQTPGQLAAAHVNEVTRPEVLQAVRHDLANSLTLGQLRGSVDVSVDPSSNLVIVDAHARHAAQAAAISNAFAQNDARLTTMETRRTYAIAAAQIARKAPLVRDATARVAYLEQLSRLQSLSAVALPVQFTAMAVPPSTPTSPRPVRNTLAAALLGLLLGLTLAYARGVLDHKLRHPDDVEKYVGHPILGYVQSEALGHTAGLTNGRDSSAGATDQEAFRILRQNVHYLDADKDVGSLVVTSAMADEGKSTVAIGLATASAAAGKQTLLIECDLRRPVLATRLGIQETPGLTDYLTGHADSRHVLQHVPLATPDDSSARNGNRTESDDQMFVCITAGTPPPRPAELLASERFRMLLAEVVQVYDLVIVDSAPILSVADTLNLIPNVAGVLVCVRVDQTTRDEARAARTALERLPSRPTGVVLTGLSNGGAGYQGYYTPYTPAGNPTRSAERPIQGRRHR